ncbi:distal membrane-arm assembly complex protein 2 [Augochlora pura]
MLYQVQRSTQMITEVLGNIRPHNKQHVNIIRNFYNSKGAVNFFLQNIRKRRNDLSNLVYKRDDEEDENPEDAITLKTILFPDEAPAKHHLLQFHFSEFWAYMKREYAKYAERKIHQDNLMLGPEIACTILVLRNRGKVKIYNKDEWIEKTERFKTPELPKFHDPDFILEAIDLKGYPILYENIETMCDLSQLRWLNLSGCSTIDDWALDRISAEFPALEHLDVSNCINVTEKGLQALYKIPNLKKLIVTDFHNSAALELTCFMLEDINPFLKCEIIKIEMKLLEEN